MKKRILGIDLLKIISMLMIITLHIIGKGGMLSSAQNFTIKGELVWIIEILCYCSVNCYALASGYTGINSNQNKINQIISLWIQVVFYSVLGELVYILINFGQPISLVSIIKACMPVITSKYWYFTAYFGMFLFIPILNGIIKEFNKETLKKGFIYSLLVFCVLSSFMSIESMGLLNGYSFLWLCFMYLVGAYLKHYGLFENYNRKNFLMGYFLCSLLVWLSKIIIGMFTNLIVGEVLYATIFVDYNNLLIVFASICLLGFFVKVPISEKYEKIIRVLSLHTFGVYIIHLTPVIYELFSGRFVNFLNYNVFLMVISIILSSMVIFLLCTCTDLLRHKLFQLLKVNNFCLFISKKIEIMTNYLLKF